MMMGLTKSAALIFAATLAAAGVLRAEPPAPVLLRPAGSAVRGLSVDATEFRVGIAWSEDTAPDRSRIHYLELRDGRHGRRLAPVPVDVSAVGRNEDVVVRFHPATGQPSFAWVHADGTGYLLMMKSGRDAAPEIVSATTNPIELPTIAFDGAGTGYLAWTELVGSRSEVFAARQTSDGWAIDQLTRTRGAYDLLPQVFARESGAEVYWYSLTGEVFEPRLAILGEGGVEHHAARSLGALPTEWLPVLFKSSRSAPPGAFWLRPTRSGQLIERLPSSPALNRSLEAPFGAGDSIQTRPAISPTSPAPMAAVVLQDEEWMIAAEVPGAPLWREPADRSAVPSIALTRNNVHLLWYQDAGDGGDGSLWYRRLPLR